MAIKLNQLDHNTSVNTADAIVEQRYVYELLDDENLVIDGARTKVRDLTSKQVLFDHTTRRGQFHFTVSFDVVASTDPHRVLVEVNDVEHLIMDSVEINCRLNEAWKDVRELIKSTRSRVSRTTSPPPAPRRPSVPAVSEPSKAVDHPEAYDLHQDLTITPTEARAGSTKQISIERDGRKEILSVNIPAGVNSGSKVRLAGKGLPGPLVGTGHLYLTIKIESPPVKIEAPKEILPPPDSKPDPKCPKVPSTLSSYRGQPFETICRDLETQYRSRMDTLRYFDLVEGDKKPAFRRQLRGEQIYAAPTFDQIRNLLRTRSEAQRLLPYLNNPLLLVTPFGIPLEVLIEKILQKNGKMVAVNERVPAHAPKIEGNPNISQDKTYYLARGAEEKDRLTKQQILNGYAWNTFPGWLVTIVDGEQEVKEEPQLEGNFWGNLNVNEMYGRWTRIGWAPLTIEESLMMHAEVVIEPFENHGFNKTKAEVLLGTYNTDLNLTHPYQQDLIRHGHFYTKWRSASRQLSMMGARKTPNCFPRRAVRLL